MSPGVRKTKPAPKIPKKETVAEIRCRCPIQARSYTQVLQEGNPRQAEQMIWPELVLEWNDHFKGLSRLKKRELGKQYLTFNSVIYYGELLPKTTVTDEFMRALPLIHNAPF